MEKELMLMVGPIGAGKTTFARSLENSTSIRISQDEQGRRQHRELFNQSVEEGIPRIIVDRMNFNKEQRARYINKAREHGYVITVFEFEWDWDTCYNRVMTRIGHPTIGSGDHATTEKVLHMFQGMYEPLSEDEYDNYNLVEMKCLKNITL